MSGCASAAPEGLPAIYAFPQPVVLARQTEPDCLPRALSN